MTNLLKKVENILRRADLEEYKQEAKMLVCGVSGLDYEDILLNEPLEFESQILELAQKRAQDRIPIQHLLGFSYFMGKKYKVNSSVLIPRDETELLVLKAAELLSGKKEKIDILDVGVGSGCISCTLANILSPKNIEILGVDISKSAILTALDNINGQNLIRKVVLRKSDLFSAIKENEKFDLIVSNPPYIPIAIKDTLQIEVREYEPSCALYTNDDLGLEFYEKIISKAPKHLKQEGFIAFEAGVNQAGLIQKMLEKDFENIEITPDLAGIERVISAKLK